MLFISSRPQCVNSKSTCYSEVKHIYLDILLFPNGTNFCDKELAHHTSILCQSTSCLMMSQCDAQLHGIIIHHTDLIFKDILKFSWHNFQMSYGDSKSLYSWLRKGGGTQTKQSKSYNVLVVMKFPIKNAILDFIIISKLFQKMAWPRIRSTLPYKRRFHFTRTVWFIGSKRLTH